MYVEWCHTSIPRNITCFLSTVPSVDGTLSIKVNHVNFSVKGDQLLRNWWRLVIDFHGSKKRCVEGCDFAWLRCVKLVVGFVYKEVIGVIVTCWFFNLAIQEIALKAEEFLITGLDAFFADFLNMLLVLGGVFCWVCSFKALKTIRPADSFSIFELF